MTNEEKNAELAMYVKKYEGKRIKHKYDGEEFQVFFVGVVDNAIKDNDQFILCFMDDGLNGKGLKANPYFLDKYYDVI